MKFYYSQKLLITLFVILAFLVINNEINAQSEIPIELTNIKFIGNDFFDNSDLETIILSKESPNWFSQFLNSFTSFGNPPIYFDSLNVDSDIEYLTFYYKANGFFKTNITADYIIDNYKADLVFHINENKPSYVRKFQLKGLTFLPVNLANDIDDIITIDTTSQFSENLLEENNILIQNLLQDNGYMLAETNTPIVEIDTLSNVVDIIVNFDLGKRYRISNVTVEKSGPGNDLVSKELIEEIADIKINKYYSYHKLKLAQIRLYRTNLFSSAVIAGKIQDTVGNYVPVNILTKVGLLNELSPEIIGINEENTFKLGLGLNFTNKNFLGDARKLTIGTSAAAHNIGEFIKKANLTSNDIFGYADARVGLEQPFLFGKPINTKLETFYTLEKKRDLWNAKIYGAKLNFIFELPKYTYLTSLSAYFNWEKINYIYTEKFIQNAFTTYFKKNPSQIYTTSEVDSLIDGSLESNATNVVLGVRLGHNKTDDFLFPTRGYSLSITLEDGNSIPYYMSKIGNYNYNNPVYYKLVINSSFYLPIFIKGEDAFGFKFKIGNIQAYQGSINDIPLNQRFTAGGSNSVRGWKTNELAPIDLSLPNNISSQDIENVLVRNITPGGFFLFEGSIEARTHLMDKIGLAIFSDYGNVWNKFTQFRYDEIAIAAGFGFRYYSDFAPIRLDFGFKAYDPNDRRDFFTRLKHLPFLQSMEFQIGIGEAF